MALISIAAAAEKAGLTVQHVEAWAAQGLIELRSAEQLSCVDEDQFHDLVESQGWLQLSMSNWDENEDE